MEQRISENVQYSTFLTVLFGNEAGTPYRTKIERDFSRLEEARNWISLFQLNGSYPCWYNPHNLQDVKLEEPMGIPVWSIVLEVLFGVALLCGILSCCCSLHFAGEEKKKLIQMNTTIVEDSVVL